MPGIRSGFFFVGGDRRGVWSKLSLAAVLAVLAGSSLSIANEEGVGTGAEDTGCDGAHETGEGDVCRDDTEDEHNCPGGATGTEIDPLDEDLCDINKPVTPDTGRKWEVDDDLVVRVTGKDFRLSRLYSSTPPDSPDNPASPYDNALFFSGLGYQPSVTIASPNTGNNWGVANLRAMTGAVAWQLNRTTCVVTSPGAEAQLYRPHRKAVKYSRQTAYPLTPSGPGNQVVSNPPVTARTASFQDNGNGGTICDWDTEPSRENFLATGEMRLIEPGKWIQTFDLLEGQGWIYKDEDVHGNIRYYLGSDDVTDSGGATPEYIFLNGDSLDPADADCVEAFLRLYWGSGTEEGVRLFRAEVYRPLQGGTDSNGDGYGEELTQFVDYYYLDYANDKIRHWDTSTSAVVNLAGADPHGNSGTSDKSDLGNDGDLVMVVTGQLGGDDLFYRRITQYRYHDTRTSGYTLDPDDNDLRGEQYQLKMLLPPRQVEYAAQKRNKGETTYDQLSTLDMAIEMLELPDVATGASTAVYSEGGTDHGVLHFAEKLVSYDTSDTEAKVERQFLQAGECGCGGSGALQSAMWEYDYIDWGGTESSTGYDGMSQEIVQKYYNPDSSSYASFRTVYTDLIMPDALKPEINYIRGRVIVDDTSASSGPWVRRFGYDADTLALMGKAYPSVFKDYTPATTSAAPIVDRNVIANGDRDGFRKVYSYPNENTGSVTLANNDASELAVQRQVTYTTTNIAREHLPATIKRYQDEDDDTNEAKIETTTLSYEFYPLTTWSGLGTTIDGPVMKWIEREVELELQGENGPTTVGTSSSYQIFHENGNLLWEIDADDSVTAYEYDRSGEVTKITRNAAPPDGNTLSDLGLSAASTLFPSSAPGGGSLETQFIRDSLGRVIQVIRPGNVSSYTRYEVGPDADRPGIWYLTHVDLPHELSTGVYDGPGRVTVMECGGNVTRVGEFEIDGAADYDPNDNDYALLTSTGELSRMVYDHNRAGSMTRGRTWWNLSEDPYEETFEYDGVGRRVAHVNGVGTKTETVYDVLNRVIEVKVGTETVTPVTVAEYFFDGDPAEAPAQGIGDGNLSHVRLTPGGSEAQRVYRHYHDYRNRRIATVSPEAPWEVVQYDNLDRVVGRALFSGTHGTGGDSWPPTLAQVLDNYSDLEDLDSNRVALRGLYSRASFSQRGLLYRREQAIEPDSSTTDFLEWNWWFDSEGNEVASWAPNSPGIVRVLDGLDRPTDVYVTDRSGNFLSSESGYTHGQWVSVTTDVVIEQTEFDYSTNDDLLEMVTTHRRNHTDNPSSTKGPLNSQSSVRISTYTGYLYDDANRPLATVEYGTNDPEFKTGTSAPTLPSSPSFNGLRDDGDVLFTWNSYNTRGLLEDQKTVQSGTGGSAETITTRTLYDDANRVLAVVENAVNVDLGDFTYSASNQRWSVSGLSSEDSDRVTSYVYDANNNIVKQVAHLTSGGFQETAYDYGVSSGSGTMDSEIDSEDLLEAVRYPDETTGIAGTTGEYTVSYAYNRLGELLALTDQNGTVRTVERDDLGRVEADIASTLGSGVDDHIERIETSYDTLGRVSTVTSYSDTSGTTDENGVLFDYNGLWQITSVAQDHTGEATGSSPKVTYEYETAEPGAGATDNHSRVTGLIYPKDTTTTLSIGYASGVDDRISRVSGLDVTDLTSTDDNLVDYEYVGLGVLATASIPAPGTGDLDGGFRLDRFIEGNGKETTGTYHGYDRFGRLAEQRWVHSTYDEHLTDTTLPNIPPIFEETYAYDRASNRIDADDTRPGAHLPNRDRAYTYDQLNRLTEATHSQAGATNTYARLHSEKWTLDLLGNWKTFAQDTDDDGTYEPSGSPDESEDRTHNRANEVDDITVGPTSGGVNVTLNHTYDKNGNMTKARRTVGQQVTDVVHTYDAWNRLVATSQDPGGVAISEYDYNGLNWRIAKRMDTGTGARDGTLDQERELFYSAGWQILEERIDEDDMPSQSPYGPDGSVNTISQHFWGARYIDDLVAKRVDRDADGEWDDPECTAWFAVHDAIYSVRAMLDDESLPYERVDYDAYGEARHRRPNDLDNSGTADFNDFQYVLAGAAGSSIGGSAYVAEADFDFDGDVDTTDVLYYQGLAVEDVPDGWVSDPSSTSGPDNSIGYAGYRFNAESGNYQVRIRTYTPPVGRWLQRDYARYLDGMSMYMYVVSNPIDFVDPLGAWAEPPFRTKVHNDVFADFGVGDADMSEGNTPRQRRRGRPAGVGSKRHPESVKLQREVLAAAEIAAAAADMAICMAECILRNASQDYVDDLVLTNAPVINIIDFSNQDQEGIGVSGAGLLSTVGGGYYAIGSFLQWDANHTPDFPPPHEGRLQWQLGAKLRTAGRTMGTIGSVATVGMMSHDFAFKYRKKCEAECNKKLCD